MRTGSRRLPPSPRIRVAGYALCPSAGDIEATPVDASDGGRAVRPGQRSRRTAMRSIVPVTWGGCVLAVALTATACGGGGADGGGTDASGVVRSSWGDPQNPLEPANTN